MKNQKQETMSAAEHEHFVRSARIGERERVFICSPFAGDIDMNTCRARRFCVFAVTCGYTPFASHLLFPQFLDEADPAERERGILMGLSFLPDCREIWVFGTKISSGMSMEIARAQELRLVIRYFTNQCEEVPAHAQ